MMNLPSPTEIQYFIELAQTANMSRAAERLGIRQPTLSVALAKLEQTLGSQLFVRTKKGVTLTEEGNFFLLRSQELLRVWQETKNQTQLQSRSISGHIRFGCHVSVALYSLSHFIPQIMKAHRGLDFSLEHDFSRKIVEAVISLRLDIGIAVNPVQHPDLIIKKLCTDEVAFWRAARGTPDHVLIADQQLIQVQSLMQKSKKAGFEKFVTTSSLEVARELAEAGAGVAILPARVALHRNRKRLVRMLDFPVYKDEICLIYRSEQRTNKTIQMISSYVGQIFS